jgi:hypothetical protein
MPSPRPVKPARPDAKTLTVAQAAAEADISVSAIYRLIADGTLTWVGGTGCKRIPRKSLAAWRDANTVRGRY